MGTISICPLESGSKGNSHLIEAGETCLLVDLGISLKALLEHLKVYGKTPNDIKGVVITHEHTDHTKGVGAFVRKYKIPVYATRGSWRAMYKNVSPIDDEYIKVITPDENFQVGDICVRAFSISHDAAQPVGYNFFFKDKKISVATDTGVADKSLLDAVMGADVALIEANHDENMLLMGKYSLYLKHRIKSELGHLSNKDAGHLSVSLLKGGTKTLLMGHLSEENNYPDLAYLTVKNIIEENGFKDGEKFCLKVVTKSFEKVQYFA